MRILSKRTFPGLYSLAEELQPYDLDASPEKFKTPLGKAMAAYAAGEGNPQDIAKAVAEQLKSEPALMSVVSDWVLEDPQRALSKYINNLPGTESAANRSFISYIKRKRSKVKEEEKPQGQSLDQAQEHGVEPGKDSASGGKAKEKKPQPGGGGGKRAPTAPAGSVQITNDMVDRVVKHVQEFHKAISKTHSAGLEGFDMYQYWMDVAGMSKDSYEGIIKKITDAGDACDVSRDDCQGAFDIVYQDLMPKLQFLAGGRSKRSSTGKPKQEHFMDMYLKAKPDAAKGYSAEELIEAFSIRDILKSNLSTYKKLVNQGKKQHEAKVKEIEERIKAIESKPNHTEMNQLGRRIYKLQRKEQSALQKVWKKVMEDAKKHEAYLRSRMLQRYGFTLLSKRLIP